MKMTITIHLQRMATSKIPIHLLTQIHSIKKLPLTTLTELAK